MREKLGGGSDNPQGAKRIPLSGEGIKTRDNAFSFSKVTDGGTSLQVSREGSVSFPRIITAAKGMRVATTGNERKVQPSQERRGRAEQLRATEPARKGAQPPGEPPRSGKLLEAAGSGDGPEEGSAHRQEPGHELKHEHTETPVIREVLERGKIRAGATLKDLFVERGYTGKRLEPFVYDLLREWHRDIVPVARQILSQPLPEQELASLGSITADVDGVNVCILGVDHGITTAGSTLDTPYAQRVRQFIVDKRETGSFFSEQVLDKIFGLNGLTHSLHDVDNYLDLLAREENFAEDIDLTELFNRERKRARRGITLPHNEGIDLAAELESLFLEGPNIQQILQIIKIYDSTKLPEPLDMECGLILAAEGNDVERNLLIDRSKLQVEEIIPFLPNLSTSGVLCGFAHKSQIAYLLTHPDYDPRMSVKEAVDAVV